MEFKLSINYQTFHSDEPLFHGEPYIGVNTSSVSRRLKAERLNDDAITYRNVSNDNSEKVAADELLNSLTEKLADIDYDIKETKKINSNKGDGVFKNGDSYLLPELNSLTTVSYNLELLFGAGSAGAYILKVIKDVVIAYLNAKKGNKITFKTQEFSLEVNNEKELKKALEHLRQHNKSLKQDK
ncbi:hypothetical protein L2747_13495 [Shewanella marinintestina]|uniref:hypothetical protein n=1 Tax=Shewanella marinintestina TaxID=190305 RepID=UPI00200DF11F|nr:hypothetical protein [Shewanella marinintestina]MCL1147012.1 hypothetical protein [Shewanella marinintestina]